MFTTVVFLSFLFAVVSMNALGGVDQVQAQIIQTQGDVSEQMRHDAKEFAKEVYALHGDKNLPQFAADLKDKYDAKYGGSWNVFAAAGKMSFKTLWATFMVLSVNGDTVFIGR